MVLGWLGLSRGTGGMMNDHWVSVADVAEHLGVARDTVYRWIESKGLPAYRVGRHWKFQLADVDRWVRDGGSSREGADHSKVAESNK